MSFYGQISSDDPLSVLFIVLSLLNVYYALRVSSNIRQRWAELQREPLRHWQKHLIDQAAFLLGIPLGVVIHELAHALAIWLFGGRVIDVGYGFYWGYVVPAGFFTFSQEWIISIAGTLGSLIYGVVVWSLFKRIHRSSYQYFGWRVLRVHLFYSLVFYPIFTLVTFVGDWRVIYDFSATPLLSGITLVVHIGTLGLFLWADRQGMFEMPAFESLEAQEKFKSLQAKVAINPNDPKLSLDMVEAYRIHGEKNKARKELRSFLKVNPQSAEGYLQSAALKADGKRQVPKGARDDAAKALSLGLGRAIAVAYANQLIGRYELGVGRLDQSIHSFSRALEKLNSTGSPEFRSQLRYNRAMAYRRKGNYELARQDIKEAIALSRVSGQGAALSHFEAELTTINQEADQSFRN